MQSVCILIYETLLCKVASNVSNSSFSCVPVIDNVISQGRHSNYGHHWRNIHIVRSLLSLYRSITNIPLTYACRCAYIAASFSKTIWELMLSQGVCYGVGMGICFSGTASLVPQWFNKRRSLANGIATSGTGFGGLTYSLAANAMIQKSGLGIAWTFRIMAIICFVVITVSALFLKDRGEKTKATMKAFEWKLFKMLDFWLFMAWLWLSSLGYVVVVFSLSAYAQQVGFSAQQGSLVSAMFNRTWKYSSALPFNLRH